MHINIDPNSRVPLYLQIVNNIKRSIALGSLHYGEQIPSIREIANSYRINPNTVSRAFKELRAASIVTAKVGIGTIIIDKNTSKREQECRAIITDMLDQAISEAELFNLDRHQIWLLFEDRLSKHYDTSSPGRM